MKTKSIPRWLKSRFYPNQVATHSGHRLPSVSLALPSNHLVFWQISSPLSLLERVGSSGKFRYGFLPPLRKLCNILLASLLKYSIVIDELQMRGVVIMSSFRQMVAIPSHYPQKIIKLQHKP